MSHHFVSANLWFAAGVILLLGNGPSPSLGYGPSPYSARDEAFYGYGKFDTVPVALGIAALFAVAFWNLRRWPEADRRKVPAAVFYLGANGWFILGLALLVGIGQHSFRTQHVAVFGYGPLYQVPAYAGVGLVFAAAVWNFRHWRRANQPAVDAPAPRAARTVEPRHVVLFGSVALGVILLLGLMTTMRSDVRLPAVKPLPVRVASQQPTVDHQPLPWPEVPTPPPVSQVEVVPSRFVFIVPVFGIFVLTAIAVVAWKRSRTPSHRPAVADERRSRPVVPAPTSAAAPVYTAPYHQQQSQQQHGQWQSQSQSQGPPPSPAACPKCRSPLAADAPGGLCPRCLMAGVFRSVVDPGRTGPGGPVEPPTPEEVQEHFPNLEILALLGQGGMGAVYQARQPNLDRTVALKLIRPREDNPMFAERFVREAKAMAKLSHPNIVHIHEAGEAGGSLYLIMEFVDGVTLREAIRAKAIPSAEALKIVGQLCDALEYAHGQGVVHRDIKPENILLDRTGRVKVVDFGLAKLATDNAVSLTHTRQAMGTPHYMAPEQWEKPTEVDHRADIYAVGVVIYELLTGELPLGRFDPPSVKAHLDARIDEIVLRLLAKEPDRRYQNASDVRTALFNIGPVGGAVARRGKFYEYRSKATFWGLPLVHVVSGIDPRTGTPRIARGWVAVGDVMAVGPVAVSGVCACGIVTLAGVVGGGLLAVAGAIAFGGAAIGGTAVGGFALGGVAVGWLAVGGVAVGKFALGGAAVGEHVHKKGRDDADFWKELRESLADVFD